MHYSLPSLPLHPAENHSARHALRHPGNHDLTSPTHVIPASFDDDHCAIIQVARALARLLALTDDLHPSCLPGQEDERAQMHLPRKYWKDTRLF